MPWGDLVFLHMSFRVGKSCPDFYPGSRLGSLPNPRRRENTAFLSGEPQAAALILDPTRLFREFGGGENNNGVL